MERDQTQGNVSRREMFRAAATAAMTTIASGAAPLQTLAGVDRVVILPGKTYLRGWAGYGNSPAYDRRPEPADNPSLKIRWAKVSGPGSVTFANAKSLITTA